MYYPSLSTIKNYKLIKPLIEQLDLWLASLPDTIKDRITIDMVTDTFEIPYDLANDLLEELCNVSILKKVYAIMCPNCEFTLKITEREKLIESLAQTKYCYECEEEVNPTSEDISILYSLIQKPSREYTLKRANINEKRQRDNIDSLLDEIKRNPNTLDSFFFAPNADDYKEWRQLFAALDYNYGKNKTAKGAALDKFISSIFKKVPGISVSNSLRSETNQIDCTVKNVCSIEHTMFAIFGAVFIMECKNEKKVPNITYFDKLDSIMDTDNIKFGIIVSRKKWANTCNKAAWEKFLKHERVIINLCDDDFCKIIDNRGNLLTILHNKYIYLSTNATSPIFD